MGFYQLCRCTEKLIDTPLEQEIDFSAGNGTRREPRHCKLGGPRLRGKHALFMSDKHSQAKVDSRSGRRVH